MRQYGALLKLPASSLQTGSSPACVSPKPLQHSYERLTASPRRPSLRRKAATEQQNAVKKIDRTCESARLLIISTAPFARGGIIRRGGRPRWRARQEMSAARQNWTSYCLRLAAAQSKTRASAPIMPKRVSDLRSVTALRIMRLAEPLPAYRAAGARRSFGGRFGFNSEFRFSAGDEMTGNLRSPVFDEPINRGCCRSLNCSGAGSESRGVFGQPACVAWLRVTSWISGMCRSSIDDRRGTRLSVRLRAICPVIF